MRNNISRLFIVIPAKAGIPYPAHKNWLFSLNKKNQTGSSAFAEDDGFLREP